ncbi:MAG: CoA transferase [Myxococcota bacterium]|nr:CoA transferase [Myxococcota bacterium]
MSGPLEGIRVVDLTTMISGPIATRILADQGADVIKVEAPGTGDLVRAMGSGRDGLSATFVLANRNKRSVVLDLKQSEGLAALLRLVESADVFVQNFRPGKADALGLSEPALRERAPGLVYVSISGFGEQGPYAGKRVYDPVIQALSGLADVQSDRDTGRPRMMRLIIPDKLTALASAQAISAALVARERSGVGQHVRLAMLDATLEFMWPEAMAAHTFTGRSSKGRPQLAQDLIFQTADGYMTAGAVSDAEWRALAHVAGHPEWLEDERFATAAGRVLHADARLALMAEAFRSRATGEWLVELDAAGVPCAPVLRREDLASHPQIEANDVLVEHEHPVAGAVREPRPAARFERTPSGLRMPAPGLGEHSDPVLAEAGYSPDEIRELREAGVTA